MVDEYKECINLIEGAHSCFVMCTVGGMDVNMTLCKREAKFLLEQSIIEYEKSNSPLPKLLVSRLSTPDRSDLPYYIQFNSVVGG